MRPVLFTWRGVNVHSYRALLFAGLACGAYAGGGAATASGVDPTRAMVAILALMIPALVGARLWFVLSNWSTYERDRGRIWRRGEGGAALAGGLLLALAVSPAVLVPLDLQFGSFWDAATFTMLVGLMFTRAGCLLNGCCSGRACEGRLGLHLPDHTGEWKWRYPIQLIELGAASALLAAAAALLPGRPFAGAVFAFALGAYGAIRLILDPLRDRGPHGPRSRGLAI